MARNRGTGGYDLAGGFSTLIRGNEEIVKSLKDMTATLSQSAEMQQRYSGVSAPGTDNRAAVVQAVSRVASGQTMSESASQTYEQVRSSAASQIKEAVLTPAHPSVDSRPGNGSSGYLPDLGRGAPGGGVGPIGPGWLDRSMRTIPGVDLGLRGVDEWTKQVGAGNTYRRIEGGSNLEGFSERIMAQQYRLQAFGVLGGEDAQKAFQTATQLGYGAEGSGARNTRQDAVNYIYDSAKDRGQTVDESARQLELVSRSASLSIGLLNKSMNDISDSARKAGVNTEMARANFMGMVQQSINMGTGQGGVDAAKAVSLQSTSIGRAYTANVDSSQTFSQDREYRAAAISGITQHQLRNLTRNDPIAALTAYGKLDQSSYASSQVTPEMQNWIKGKVSDLKANGGELDEDTSTQIANEFLDTFPINDNAFMDNLGTLQGKKFGNVQEAAKFLVNNLGGNSALDVAKRTLTQSGPMDKNGMLADGTKNPGVAANIKEFSAQTTTSAWSWDRAKSGLIGGIGIGNPISAVISGVTSGLWGGSQQSGAAADYIAKTGDGARDPVIESLLSQSGLQGSAGDDAMVQVQTKSGMRAVKLSDAIDKFPNELRSGKVKILNGNYANKTVAEVTGKGITNIDTSSERQQSAPDGSMSMADWNAKNGTDAQKAAAGVQFGLTEDAKKLITLLDMNGNPYAAAQAAGVPPTPSGVRSVGGVKGSGG